MITNGDKYLDQIADVCTYKCKYLYSKINNNRMCFWKPSCEACPFYSKSSFIEWLKMEAVEDETN